jgi:hypothetical protein
LLSVPFRTRNDPGTLPLQERLLFRHRFSESVVKLLQRPKQIAVLLEDDHFFTLNSISESVFNQRGAVEPQALQGELPRAGNGVKPPIGEGQQVILPWFLLGVPQRGIA